MSKLTWEWLDGNWACIATVEDLPRNRKYELAITPKDGTGFWVDACSRRGPFYIDVLTCDERDNVLASRNGTRKYTTLKDARAAAARLMRRVRQKERKHEG